MPSLEFYMAHEAEQFVFYRIPKILFTDKRFSKISSDAKLLYSLFLDRMSLSKKNGLIDEEKRVYIYFSVEEVQEEFGVASQKAIKMIAELDDIKGCGLIHRKKQGQGKPTKIYVMKYTSENKNEVPEKVQCEDIETNDTWRFSQTRRILITGLQSKLQRLRKQALNRKMIWQHILASAIMNCVCQKAMMKKALQTMALFASLIE